MNSCRGTKPEVVRHHTRSNGDDTVKVARNGADVAINGPLVVVEHDDEALGLRSNVIERFVGDAAGEGGVPGKGDHVLFAAQHIASDSDTRRKPR